MKTSKNIAISTALVFVAIGVFAPAAQADFGVNSLSVSAYNRDGSQDLQAGSHPFEYRISFRINEAVAGIPDGTLKSLVADLPPGLVGNPQAVPTCSGGAFEGLNPRCPGNTQVGVVEVKGAGLQKAEVGLYNLSPPTGVPANLGAAIFNVESYQEASLRATDYGVRVSDVSIPTKFQIQSVTERIWGTPSDPSHDAERICPSENGEFVHGCSSESARTPFLTLPTSCTGPLLTTVGVESLEEPGMVRSETVESLEDGGNPAGLDGCERPQFTPTVRAQPETPNSDSPTGLEAAIRVPQSLSSEGLATANLKSAVVALPAGLSLNPSIADGLAACALEGPEGINLPGSAEPAAGEPAKCPAASKVGTVEIQTPLIDHTLPGVVYVARQGENPFHSLLALYIAVDDPITGVVVKIAGKVEPNASTGQLTAIFPNNPQLPFENLNLDFSGGPRAALTTPSACGTYATTADLTPWTSPEGVDAHPSDSFEINSGPTGSCPATEAQMANHPSFEAGTSAPLAGSYAPFVLKVSRENGSQRLGSVDVTLPPGLLGRISGIPYCGDAQIAVAASRGNPGQGALELASPSCPVASEVGTATVGAGSGNPFYAHGHVYLAGPYRGAPLSLEIVTPAVAGPFDLGSVAVRAALYVNESTAQIHAVSDPLPTILQGIPLDIRTIALDMNRREFTLNPTSCNPTSVLGTATSTLGQAVSLQNRFQVGGCNGLDFKPALKLTFSGETKRAGFPAVKAVLTQPKGQNANLSSATAILPKGMLIANAHINSPCTRVQFNSGSIPGEGCPAKSVLGSAKVWSPLLEQPEEGKVYFRSNGGERKLPDLAIALRGQIPLQLIGFIDSVGREGAEVRRVRSRFLGLPDAPVSRFELKLAGGKKGLLQNSKNLCKFSNRATVQLTGQNGKTYDTEPNVQVSCGKQKKKATQQRSPRR